LWPIWLFFLADMVFSCGRCGCGRYGTDPKKGARLSDPEVDGSDTSPKFHLNLPYSREPKNADIGTERRVNGTY